MSAHRRLVRDDSGVAAIEMAFALPILLAMIWMIVQLGMVYRAVAGIQQALGEGARYATLCVNPDFDGCDAPTPAQVRTKVLNSVFGIGPGDFSAPLPTTGTSGTAQYYDVTVDYTQETNLLLFPGPTINVSKSKRVWLAAT
jgi:Flp pilus assembly pilin Flp